MPIGENPFVFSVVADLLSAAAEELKCALILYLPLQSKSVDEGRNKHLNPDRDN